MSETKFTPGPWVATTTKAGKGKVIDAYGFSVCNTNSGTYKQQLIDAHLIAAAPEMYDSAYALIESVMERYGLESTDDLTCEYMRRLAASLAKARGEV